MVATIEAIFEQGVFRPLTPIELDEGAHVDLTLRTKPARRRFIDRTELPEFTTLPRIPGDTTPNIGADRDRT